MPNRRLALDAATTTVNTSTAETDLTVVSIPPNGLAADGVVRLTAVGDFLNNTGSADTITFKVKLGTSVALTTPTISLAASTTRRKWRLELDIIAETDTAQRLSAVLHISDAATDNFAADGVSYTGYGTDTETGTAAVDVSVTATLGTSSALLEVRHHAAILEAIR
jgi:hypothetical protein